ncbi:MAG: penicillin-binding transpeptidase domain-containing protein, partial [Actinomycetota bacterium]
GYATLASSGVYHKPTGVTSIFDTRRNETLYEATKPKGDPVISAAAAYVATTALEGVISGGTGTAANIGRPAAGKTGTGQEYRDAWFAGYTPDLAAAVWIGYPEGEIAMTSTRIGSVTGGSWPAMIWQAFMSQALVNTPASDFTPPSGLTYVTLDSRRGCLAGSFTPEQYQVSVPVIPGSEPTKACTAPPPPPKDKDKDKDKDDEGDEGDSGDNGNGGGGNGGGNGNGKPGD